MVRKTQEEKLLAEFEEQIFQDFLEILGSSRDPRRKQGQRYSLPLVLMCMFLGCICGANSATGFERWSEAHHSRLKLFFEMPHGTPTQDVFLSVLASFDPVEFGMIFEKWVNLCLCLKGKLIDQSHIAIDGKSSKRSYDLNNNILSAHTLSVMAVNSGIVISQSDCDRKTNEIIVIREILEKLKLAGSTITIDAMAAQVKIIDTIVEKEAEFIIGLKKNQRKLYEDVENIVEENKTSIEKDKIDNHDYHISFDKGHGRIEQRETYIFRDLSRIRDKSKWKNLSAIIMVVRTITKMNPKQYQQETTTETQYYITNKSRDSAKSLANYIRNHWQIENGCHWVLDVVFREDDARNRARYSAANFAILRRMALNILKSDDSKDSINIRRQRASWSFDYLLKLLGVKQN